VTKVLLLLSLLSLPLLAAEIPRISSYHQSNQWIRATVPASSNTSSRRITSAISI
jgi:hypothetical protein